MDFKQDGKVRMNGRQRAQQRSQISELRTFALILSGNGQPEKPNLCEPGQCVGMNQHLFMIEQRACRFAFQQELQTGSHCLSHIRRRTKSASIKRHGFRVSEQRTQRGGFTRELILGAAVCVIERRQRSHLVCSFPGLLQDQRNGVQPQVRLLCCIWCFPIVKRHGHSPECCVDGKRSFLASGTSGSVTTTTPCRL